MHGISEKNESEEQLARPQTPPSNKKRNAAETKPGQRPPRAVFGDLLLENPHLKRPKRLVDVLISLAGQIAFVIFLLLIPLMYTQALNLPEFQKTMLVLPPPPPPPPPKALERVIVKPRVSLFKNNQLIAPRVIPKEVRIIKEAPQQAMNGAGVLGGVPGGVAGGTLGGVLGGVLGPGTVPAPPPPPKAVRGNGPLRVGGRVQAPRLIRRIQPVYPALARETRTQGMVILDCVIDQHGNVTNMKLVSGNPLLVQSAFSAVQQWKYQPTLLNGIPVAVEMEVQVSFVLGG